MTTVIFQSLTVNHHFMAVNTTMWHDKALFYCGDSFWTLWTSMCTLNSPFDLSRPHKIYLPVQWALGLHQMCVFFASTAFIFYEDNTQCPWAKHDKSIQLFSAALKELFIGKLINVTCLSLTNQYNEGGGPYAIKTVNGAEAILVLCKGISIRY